MTYNFYLINKIYYIDNVDETISVSININSFINEYSLRSRFSEAGRTFSTGDHKTTLLVCVPVNGLLTVERVSDLPVV